MNSDIFCNEMLKMWKKLSKKVGKMEILLNSS